MHRLLPLFVLVWAVLATGCAGLGGGGVTQISDRPMLEMEPTSEAQRRAKVHTELGMAYFEAGRFDIALDAARSAFGYESGYAPAHHLMALVHMLVGDANAARDNFQRAIAVAPNDPDFNNSYGWFLCTVGEEQEGLRRLALAASNPYYRYATRPYTNSGLCHLRLNNEEAAKAQFKLAATVDPNNGQALYYLAAIAYRQADYASARDYLVQLHQRREPTAESVWLGVRTERRLGNREAENSYAEQLRGRFEKSPQYQALKQGKYE